MIGRIEAAQEALGIAAYEWQKARIRKIGNLTFELCGFPSLRGSRNAHTFQSKRVTPAQRRNKL
jgi:hypothetical protein